MERCESFAHLAKTLERNAISEKRSVVCVQGLGFVGSVMALTVASARNEDGTPVFNVVGVELPTPEGVAKVEAINAGKFPIQSIDLRIEQAIAVAQTTGNFIATTRPEAYQLASVCVVDIPLDLAQHAEGRPTVCYDAMKKAIRTIAMHMPPGGLILVETTVPPGTCAKIVAPEIQATLRERGFPEDSILLAHSYERVMPGESYLDSIVNYWRVYSGYTPQAADACERFLSQVINTKDYPLTRLASTTASEIGKVLENSYRAMNIAFMEEWGRFAEALDVDLFEVIGAIRKRPTHSNIRQPGFGVGGYCLTKDPLFAEVAARDLFHLPERVQFPFCKQAIELNQAMPLVSLNKLEELLGGSLCGKKVLLLGVSYRPDVEDTRYSASEIFVREARERGADVVCHDPLIHYWPELEIELPKHIPPPMEMNAVVFAVSHREYLQLDLVEWLGKDRPIILDANQVLTKKQRADLEKLRCNLWSIGRGKGIG
jgi:nucleotide sugar dehydrogenase